MGKANCPDEETLACYTDNLLSEQEKEDIALHIVNCKRCSEIIDTHNKLIENPGSNKEVPKNLKDWAKGLVKEK